MTTFINNDVASGATVFASDHNTQGALIAAVVNGNLDDTNYSAKGMSTSKINGGTTDGVLITDSSGNVTGGKVTAGKIDFTTFPRFRARRVAALSVTSATQTKIPYDTEDYDIGSGHSNGTYTAPVAGYYAFTGYINIAGGTNIMTLYKNGTAYQRGTQSGSGGTTSHFEVQSALGDTWGIYIFITGATIGADVTATLQPYFNGHLIALT